jgi:site-specific recombinase XerD
MTKAIQPTPPQPIALPHPDFESLVQVVEKTVAASSARIYRQTFDRWVAWCSDNALSPFELTPRNVSAFLDSQPATKSTKQRHLSALRKLVEMLSILDYTDPAWGALHAALKKLKVQHTGGGTERSKRALAPAQADKVLRAWDGDTLQDIRNRALMTVLFLAGLRRSEAVALRWTDVDLTEGILTVRHGKGDKAREVPLLGDFALESLAQWRAAQASVAGERQYVFCPLKKSRNVIGEDKPMPDTDVYRVVKATEQRTGIVFAPHDARRTLLTEYINQTGDVPGAQRIAGHANEATTLRYAQAANARELRRKAKLRYG